MKKQEKLKKIEGWEKICALVGWSRPTLIKYGFPVRQFSRGSRVYAYAHELDQHLASLENQSAKSRAASSL